MSPHHPQAREIPGDKMEVPKAVIAQAEAAACSEDAQYPSPFAPDQRPEILGSKESLSPSSASGQKYAYLNPSCCTILRTQLARFTG